MSTKTSQSNQRAAQQYAAFSRRKFLRGLGACIALPAFESLMPMRSLAALAGSASAAGMATTASGAPLRSAFFYFPNGAIPAAWWPNGDEKNFQLSRTMQPLAELRDQIQIRSTRATITSSPA